MEVEVSRMYRFNGNGPLHAICDIVLGGEFTIKGFRVLRGTKGLFVGVPREQGKDGKWYNKVYPITDDAKQMLSQTVLKAYEEV